MKEGKTPRETVCSFESLYKAMKQCRRKVSWKDSVLTFYLKAITNICKLKKSLDNNRYKIDKYLIFNIYEPKFRIILATKFKDRVFQRSLCENYLYETLTRSFIYDNAACQKNKGCEFARKRLVKHLKDFHRKHGLNGYILKIDIHNFFGSTSHDIAKEVVTKRVKDEWVREKVFEIIDSFNHGEDPNVGLGLGSEVTQLIELAVLDELDHLIKEKLKIRHYIRYNDDMLFIHEDKEYLKYCRKFAEEWLDLKRLKISEKKTQIFPVKQGIRFLGFRFRMTETGRVIMTVLPEKVSKERRKLRKLVRREKEGLMTREDVDKNYYSWRAHVSNTHKKGTITKKAHRDTYRLVTKMDEYYKNLWEE